MHQHFKLKFKDKTAEETATKNSAISAIIDKDTGSQTTAEIDETSTIIDKDTGSQTTAEIGEKLSDKEENHVSGSTIGDENATQQAEVIEVKSQGTQDEPIESEAPIELEQTAEEE